MFSATATEVNEKREIKEKGPISVGYVRRELRDGGVELQEVELGETVIFYLNKPTRRLAADTDDEEVLKILVKERGVEAFAAIGSKEGRLVFTNMLRRRRVAVSFDQPGHIGAFHNIGRSAVYRVVGEMSPEGFRYRLMQSRVHFLFFADFLNMPSAEAALNN